MAKKNLKQLYEGSTIQNQSKENINENEDMKSESMEDNGALTFAD